ncbi:FmdB family transcriptional regulator [Ornithinimicrobium ciconiae]|uniref:FmdB family transcriptional regulator n=1 Tax=Ornithinimicrobium ciconiae TaxID=2594265 RepID=A0A516GE55_9MICO|nr:FmdB family transcriptional regulator [Ornithinimicrobium ciconiae]
MPTYSYACKDCDNAFDIQQAFSDDALTVCPTCGGTLRKRYGSVGVVFKGSGFYRTDSRKGSDSSASVPAAASTSGGGSADSSSSSSAGSSSASKSASDSSGSSTTGSAASSASTGSSKAAASA